MHSVREVIVVEGRYDKNTLSQVVDAVIVETSGFGIFNNAQKQKLLRDMAQARGLIVLTDSDGAGFVIRNFLKGALPKQGVLHAYIPDRGEALGTYWGRAGFGKNTSNLTFYIDEDGSYRSYTEVAKMWSDLDVLPSHKVAFSCGTGPRASTGWFFSYLMGWPDTALFDSGWLGWSEGKPQSPRPSQNIWDSVHNDKQLKEGRTKELPL